MTRSTTSDESAATLAPLQRLPLWVYRVLPIRVVRWVYRRELAAGQALADRLGWEDA